MKNQFEEAMAKKSNHELEKIINSSPGDYQEDAIKAAKNETRKRKMIKEEYAKYEDIKLLEIIKSKDDFQFFEVEIATEEAERRGLLLREEIRAVENKVNIEVKKLKEGVSTLKYPALRLISGVFRIVAWVIALATVIITVLQFAGGGDIGLFVAIGVLLGGGLLFITLLATSEIIKVFVDIEHNTRLSAANKVH